VLAFYRVARLCVPPAVYRELAVTHLLPALLALPWITVEQPSPEHLEMLARNDALNVLGAGEQEALALALEHPDAILLSNDRQVKRLATGYDVPVVNIPAFLVACKLAGLLDRSALAEIINLLQERDYYSFRQDVLRMLLD